MHGENNRHAKRPRQFYGLYFKLGLDSGLKRHAKGTISPTGNAQIFKMAVILWMFYQI